MKRKLHLDEMRRQQEVTFININLNQYRLNLPFNQTLYSCFFFSPILFTVIIIPSLFLVFVLNHPHLIFTSCPYFSPMRPARSSALHPYNQHQELRGGIPVRGTTVLDQNPLSCSENTLKPESEHYHQESAIEMFKVFSASEKKIQAQAGDSGGKRESYLFDERLTP